MAPTDCPADATCVSFGPAGSGCLKSCNHNADCRDANYVCDGQVCLPLDFGGSVTAGTNDGQACVMPPVAAPGMGSLFGPSIEVSEPSASIIGAECELAVDPATGHIVIMYNDIDSVSGAGTMGVVTSTDGGRSFGAPIRLPLDTTVDHNTDQSDPTVGVDPAGNFYVSWVGFDSDRMGNPSNFHIYVARSADGGLTWHLHDVSGPDEMAGLDFDKPWTAVSPHDGAVVTTYMASNSQGTVNNIRLVRSSSGATWAAPISVNDSRPTFRNLAQPVFNTDGRAVVTWVEIADQTTMFGDPGNVVYVQRFAPDGAKVGSNITVTAGADSPPFEDPTVAVFGDNVYVGFSSGGPQGHWDVRVATSTNGGASFMPSVKVNDDPTCATHFKHQVAVDAQGNVHVLYYDNRYGLGNVFHAMSPPATGAQPLVFGASTFVNDTSFPFTTSRAASDWIGDYLGVYIAGGKIYAAWTDPRNMMTSHIFFAESR
jgi:hypothetical protein